MKVTSKVISLLGIVIVVGFAFCVLCGFIFFKAPHLEMFSKAGYKFECGCLFFFKLLPALFASGLIIGYSWSFGKNKILILERFSQNAGKYIVHIIIVSLCCTLLCFVATEVGRPLIVNHQKNVTAKSQNIKEYLSLANSSYEKKEYNLALFYTKSALEINPKHKEANKLLIQIESDLQAIEAMTPVTTRTYTEVTDKPKLKNNELKVPDLMKKAMAAYDAGDYINAHYYSTLVLEVSAPEDGNRLKARQISSQAWAKLDEMKPYTNEVSKEVFNEKKDAYSALMSGDYSLAYYSFYDLLQRYPRDNDIKIYYEQSKQKLSSRCFFIDETENLQQFEQFMNIHFTLVNPKGGMDIISIAGLTTTKGTDRMITYLRDFSVISYDKDNNLLYKMSVPYAKMVTCPVDNLSKETKAFIKTNFKTNSAPYVYLKSVDRKHKNVTIEPKFECYNGYKPEFDSFYEMPVSFEKFSTLCDVSFGPQNMNLLPLISFVYDSELYGYSQEVFSYSLISRLALPLLILFCFIICGVFAWQYRIFADDSFRFIWLAMFPFIAAFSHIWLEFLKYFLGLLIYAMLGVAEKAALPVILIFCVVLDLIAALRFVAVRR